MEDFRKEVQELQGYLRVIAQHDSAIPMVVPDGRYDAVTGLAVATYQQREGLPVTGRTDHATWEALKTESRALARSAAPPVQVAPISNADLPLHLGRNSPFVLTLQQMLNHLAAQHSGMTPVRANGRFGHDTEQAVYAWQKIAVLPQTGVVDRPTWDLLAEFYLIRPHTVRRTGF